MCNNQQCRIVFLMPSRLKSHIILVLDRLQCVARVNCLVIIIIIIITYRVSNVTLRIIVNSVVLLSGLFIKSFVIVFLGVISSVHKYIILIIESICSCICFRQVT